MPPSSESVRWLSMMERSSPLLLCVIVITWPWQKLSLQMRFRLETDNQVWLHHALLAWYLWSTARIRSHQQDGHSSDRRKTWNLDRWCRGRRNRKKEHLLFQQLGHTSAMQLALSILVWVEPTSDLSIDGITDGVSDGVDGCIMVGLPEGVRKGVCDHHHY